MAAWWSILDAYLQIRNWKTHHYGSTREQKQPNCWERYPIRPLPNGSSSLSIRVGRSADDGRSHVCRRYVRYCQR